jgi:hypothetical protein
MTIYVTTLDNATNEIEVRNLISSDTGIKDKVLAAFKQNCTPQISGNLQ